MAIALFSSSCPEMCSKKCSALYVYCAQRDAKLTDLAGTRISRYTEECCAGIMGSLLSSPEIHLPASRHRRLPNKYPSHYTSVSSDQSGQRNRTLHPSSPCCRIVTTPGFLQSNTPGWPADTAFEEAPSPTKLTVSRVFTDYFGVKCSLRHSTTCLVYVLS